MVLVPVLWTIIQELNEQDGYQVHCTDPMQKEWNKQQINKQNNE